MPTKPEVPPLSAEQAGAALRNPLCPVAVGLTPHLEAIASRQHIVIRNPAGLIEKWKKDSQTGGSVTQQIYRDCIADLTTLIAGE